MVSAEVSRRDMKFLNLALKVARRSVDNHRHGCVIVSGGRPMAMACNSYCNSRHAETKAMYNLNCAGATLYVARIRKEQPAGMSAPCVNCLKAIREAGIRRVVLHH